LPQLRCLPSVSTQAMVDVSLTDFIASEMVSG